MPGERPKLMSKDEIDRFWKSAERIAAEVAKYPSWMRGRGAAGGEGGGTATTTPPAARTSQATSGGRQE